MVAQPPARPGREQGGRLAAETERIILEIESRLHRLIESSRRQSAPVAQSSVLAAAAEACAARRRLYALFGRRLFSDPSWDILLELFVSTLEGRKVTVSTACMAACAPTTTALRHIAYLVQEALVVRRPHPADARSTYLELTQQAVDRLTQYFSESD
jgi:DNA-binding MarR family transcriptional regulator